MPHNPFYYDDDFADAFNNQPGLAHRNDIVDANGNKVQDSYYFGQNGNNLLQANQDNTDYYEEYNRNKSETYEWNKLM